MCRNSCRSSTVWLSGWAGCLLLLLAPFLQAQETYGKPEDPVAAEALDVQIRTNNPGEMAYAIKHVLSVNYARQNGLEATDGEIKQFIARKKEMETRTRKEAEARRDGIQKQLQSGGVSEDDRKKLEGEQKFLDDMLGRAQEADKQGSDPKRAAAETQMARANIGQWKVNKALYKKYGGRVAYQQAGAVPLDAYYKFFKDAQKAGDLKILNKELESELWSFYTDDSKHRFYPENEKDKAINTPWWML
ncbi:MAG: hypothetical protein ABFS24_13790 [Pseudomonadota bacterium]